MTATMARKRDETDESPPPADDTVTTVKARQRLAKMIRKLGALLEINQEDVLDRYAKIIEDDLHAQAAKLVQGDPGKRRPTPG